MVGLSADIEVERVRRLSATGQFRRARRACLAALKDHPDDPRLQATKWRLDADVGLTGYAEAEQAVREIARERPDDVRLAAMAPGIVAKQGMVPEAIAEFRQLTQRFPGDPVAQMLLAGYLQADPATNDEAWQLYRHALTIRPAPTPCHRAAAYRLALRHEPSFVPMVLQGASRTERLALQTRRFGYNPLFAIMAVLMFTAPALRAKDILWGGILVALAATAFAAWVVVCNQMVCCTRCRNVWIGAMVTVWVVFALAPYFRWWAALGLGAIIGSLLPVPRVLQRARA